MKGDRKSEAHETFDLVLTKVVNARLGTTPSSATILNDDAPGRAGRCSK